MVHAIRSTTNAFAHPHPNTTRIVGMAGAIALNAALLMLLLVPMSAPPGLQLSLPETIPLIWVYHKPVPIPPVHVPITKPQPQIHAAITQPQPVVQPVVEPPVIVENGSQPAIELPADTTTQPTIGPSSVPAPGVRLEYARAPAPDYPREALREGVQGVVMLQVLADVDGRPLQVDVQRSSGDRRLDLAARRQVLQHWRFRPAMQNGRAVQAIGLVPVSFSFDG